MKTERKRLEQEIEKEKAKRLREKNIKQEFFNPCWDNQVRWRIHSIMSIRVRGRIEESLTSNRVLFDCFEFRNW